MSLSQAGPSLYYNTSPGSGDISVNGNPWGFHTYPLPGSPDGFPLVLTVGLTEDRVPAVQQALSDGAYLNKHLSQTLTARVSTNPTVLF